MKIEIAPHERMSESGSSLMRLIQNNDLPVLDLLVRESIQNSSDAANEDTDEVRVAFTLNTFDTDSLNRHFSGIEEKLKDRFPESKGTYLEIRDSNTSGLTGPLHHSEVNGSDFGNLINLVYEISKPQQREGAGGSWGLGKTIYFRIGIGLVIYYSRIKKENGEYESRLAACLVENEREENTLLDNGRGGPKRGIAWWGAPKDSIQTIPLTDDEEIKTILNDFNVAPFDEEETGTAIILPYVDNDELMHSARAIYTEEQRARYWWLDSPGSYLWLSVQRWYAPRIRNQAYSWNKSLHVEVNGYEITPDVMRSTFKIIQDLYNHSQYAGETYGNNLLTSKQVHREKINLRGTFKGGGEAGEIIFAKLTRDDLLMSPPNNQKSPYEQTNSDYNDDHYNPPLIGYIRQPGMIVNYDASGSWISKINPPETNEYIIGLFVPNSKNTLEDALSNISLEEYLRLGEKADHTSWNDWTVGEKNPMIVSKLKTNVANKINQQYKEKETERYQTKKTSVGKSIARFLLPPENFGKNPSSSEPKNPGSGEAEGVNRNTGRKSSIRISDSPEFEKDKILMPFELTIGKNVKSSDLELRVMSESGSIPAKSWESEEQIGSAFPLEIEEITFDTLTADKNQKDLQMIYNFTESELNADELMINSIVSARFDVNCGVQIHKKTESSLSVTGKVKFRTSQPNIRGVLSTSDQARGENQ
ncbi:hypothetical protein [Salisediminibacterium halotolerans]|uniref:Uncharacterized protein n=1 Tax=Salisediminibacterium halotolerans TaxID=517425 RepID=A0A1H9RDG9_9BACI|nr:hypothetical protein [Salisediminibacterium haloalkalitolerans]SER70790.1 hypothetical protein SAMN05444126_104109 [Salisediminibacterium haloalkalitolerans]